MPNLQQIKTLAAKIYLNLDNPQSVREQLKRINQTQKELRQIKQEVRQELQKLNQSQSAQSFGLDEAASIGLHLFGKHRMARAVNRQGNRAERQQKRQLKNAKQPYIKMRDLIDNYLFEGDRLKEMAKNYLQEQTKA